MSDAEDAAPPDGVAIIGMALRVPGAREPQSFWRNLCAGHEAIRFYDERQLLEAGVTPADLAHKNYVRAGAPLEGIAEFDAEFFGFGPKDAAVLDPQHRNFFECAWEALERAGKVPSRFEGPIGVFAGCGQGTYYYQNVLTNPELVRQSGRFLLRHTGNDKDFLATRLSYCLNLTGPSVSVQTACSTSLVATHLACQSLLDRESDMAIAGGVTIEFPHGHGYMYREGEVLAPDGHCRPFDKRSAGTVFGSGAGVVVLRRLEDAIADGDPIVAVIRGSAVNNDGANKVGYLAPSVEGQSLAVSEALTLSEVPAATVGYVECHGTGTAMGDPIEVAALTNAFRQTTDRRCYCVLGSVKSNIGHLDTAAGVVGLIKAAMAVQAGRIPPTINFDEPNAEIPFEDTPFFVGDRMQDWPSIGGPRRACVNSLGVGGTNAHVVLEQAPVAASATTTTPAGDRPHLLLYSAVTEGALDGYGERLAQHLEDNPEMSLADIAYTLTEKREHFRRWAVLAANDAQDAAAALTEDRTPRVFKERRLANPDVVFMLPGGGTPYVGMGRGLYDTEPVYREHVDRGLELAERLVGEDLRPFLFADDSEVEELEARLTGLTVQLPLLFIVEYALAQLWLSRGVQPSMMIGHSMGENTAACLAGVLPYEDALGLIVLRGQLIEAAPEGGSLSVPLSAEDAARYVSGRLALACDNGPELSVLSGPPDELDAVDARLRDDGVEPVRIRVNVAVHSPLLDPILGQFRAYLQGIDLKPPQIPIVSNLTGERLTDAQAIDPEYWVKQLRHTVQFTGGMRMLATKHDRIYLEVGPGRTLLTLAQQALPSDQPRATIASLRHRALEVDDRAFALTAQGRLWACGLDVELPGHAPGARMVDLPTYAFDHKHHWISPGQGARRDDARRIADVGDWFFQSTWKLAALSRRREEGEVSEEERKRYLVFADRQGVAERVVRQLRQRGHIVTTVRRGRGYGRVDDHDYNLFPPSAIGYETLFQELRSTECLPDHVVHLWTLDNELGSKREGAEEESRDDLGFYSLLRLVQARAGEGLDEPMRLTAITMGGQSLLDAPSGGLDQALLQGVTMVAPREFPGLRAQVVDLEPWTRKTSEAAQGAAMRILEELEVRTSDQCVAYRGGTRFVMEYDGFSLPELGEGASGALRHRGTYLITGGLGGIGLSLARYLAGRYDANLVLVSRRALPPRDRWQNAGPTGAVREAIDAIEDLERRGATVMFAAADVADRPQMQAVVREAKSKFGRIHGIFHAAGVVKDKLIPLKTPSQTKQVLRAKVEGTDTLDSLLSEMSPDLFVLFSSTSTAVGAAGQSDYVAANAYMNAYAESRRGREQPRTVSVNWGVWRDVGLAAAMARRQSSQGLEHDLHSTFFQLRRDAVDGTVTLEARCSPERNWWLDDHRTASGLAVVPGTGYLQLIAAAAQQLEFGAIEVMDLAFLKPLSFADGEERTVQLSLRPQSGGYAIEVRGLVESEDGAVAGYLTYAAAQLLEAGDEVSGEIDVAAVFARCPEVIEGEGGEPIATAQDQHLRLGPQWAALRKLALGQGEAIAEVALDEPADSPLHAGLLDTATGCGMRLIDGYDPGDGLWVPMTYGSVRLFGSLPARVYAHVRLLTGRIDQESATFDVTICDPDGRVVVEVEEFSIRRLERDAVFGVEGDEQTRIQATGDAIVSTDMSPAQRAFQNNLAAGISPSEGMEALERLLYHPTPPRVYVSSIDLAFLRAQADELSRPPDQTEGAFERPELNTEYLAPQNETQEHLQVLWEQLLGVSGVGVRDDFFDLGGHSLLALRMIAELRKRLGVEVALSDLFVANTIEKLAEFVGDLGARAADGGSARVETAEWTPLVPLKPTGEKTPMFCVAGQGGNPIHLRSLAQFFDRDRPFYGLQHRGLDGRSEPYESVESMAADYVRSIRSVQPQGPYLIAGYSGGGTVAFEIGRQLLASGEGVAEIIFLDSFSPGGGPAPSLTTRERLEVHLERFRKDGFGYLGGRLIARAKRGAEALSRSLSSPPPPPEPAPLSLYQRAAENWASIEARYSPQPSPLHAVLFRVKHSDAGQERLRRQQYGAWEGLTLEGLDEYIVPGTHVSMCEEPNVRVLARKLNRVLESATSRF